MSNINLTVEAINKMPKLEIATNENVRSRFIYIWDTLYGNGEAAYERESFFFTNKLRDEPSLLKATNFSIFTCFIDLAISGLSLEPGARAQCYLQGRNAYIGNDERGNKVYEGRLALTISGYGELVMRTRCGQIRHADNPVLVYEEDQFSFGDVNGQKVVNYMCNLPHTSNHIVAAYLRITRADGSIDYSVMLEEDWIRLQEFSLKNNQRWNKQTSRYEGSANALYTSRNGGIDTGFLAAKLIKHAFKTYPKVRLGNATELESQREDTSQQEIDDFYGVKAPEPEPAKPEVTPFCDPNPIAQGVTIDPANSPSDDDETF